MLTGTATDDISIHALREEGDGGCALHGIANDISIHALREEGDTITATEFQLFNTFLSTPSARRATFGCHLRFLLSLFLSTPSARRATHFAT